MDKITGTYHKPNKIGRAWYVFIRQAERPDNEAPCSVLKRNGSIDEVTLYECVQYNDGWLCRFRHVADDSVKTFPPIAQPAIDVSNMLGGPAEEAKAQAQATVSVDISAALELARKTLASDGKSIAEGLEAEVNGAIQKAMDRVSGKVVYVKADGVVVDCGRQHRCFPELLNYVQLGFNVWLPGPAGSGKTSAAEQVAKALGLAFHHQGKVMMEHSLMGYKDAQGVYQRTVFRNAWEHGGVMLLDECDSSEAKAMLAVNMIEQSQMAFPDGIVNRHKEFRLIAAANTFGLGGDADYVGRNKLDAAFLDRFITLAWPYDEEFETVLAGNPAWSRRVQSLRAKAKAKGIKVVITPRASVKGAIALAAGVSQAQVERDFIRKGMTEDQWRSISEERA